MSASATTGADFQPAGRPTCPSTFTPPHEPGQPRRTWRCDGAPGHGGQFHGGPADDDPSNRAAWDDKAADDHHPGESTVVSLHNVYVVMARVLEQRNQLLAAWQIYVAIVELLRQQAAGQGSITVAEMEAVLDTIPPWARPASTEPAAVQEDPASGEHDGPDPADPT